MDRCKFLCILTATLALHVIGAAGFLCPTNSNCICGGSPAFELDCDIDGHSIKISLLPNTYLTVECANARDIDYNKLPNISANQTSIIKSVIFKECPLPNTSFKEVLRQIGLTKTMALIFQNSRNLSNNLDKRQFVGLEDLTKLLLSVNGITYLPDDLFENMSNLTWLIIRSNGISLSENLFRPLGRLETLEISHNHMTNISGNLFSHLAFLRKLSLWQNNVTIFSKDTFTGVNVLEELDLSSNGLNELPSSIFNPLRKLKKLTLFSNKFTALPSNLFKNNEGLDTIVIFNNDVKLKYLPEAILSGLYQLKEVYVQRCGLEIIPSDAFIDSPLITKISFAHNEIECLPESVFNDQINLLELDLSYNEIKSLPPKLFSSLVKLERLKLSHNSLKEISSFPSLLSLSYFDIEHNNLETISPDIFKNNRQKIWINLAYNRLNFKHKTGNDTLPSTPRLEFPLAHLYRLKMLNLSHNQLDYTHRSFYYNSHDIVDLSFNKIQELSNVVKASAIFTSLKGSTVDTNEKYAYLIWMANNPLACDCNNYISVSYLKKQHIKVGDIDSFKCRINIKRSCEHLNYIEVDALFVIMTSVLCLSIASIVIAVAIILFKQKLNVFTFIKEVYAYFKSDSNDNFDGREVFVAYAPPDEEFVVTEIFPGLRDQVTLKVIGLPIYRLGRYNELTNCVGNCDEPDILVIILSASYVAMVHEGKDLKKVYGDISKRTNIIFIIVSDFYPDISVNPFVMGNVMNISQCVQWREPDFWRKFLTLLSCDELIDLTKVNIDPKTIRK